MPWPGAVPPPRCRWHTAATSPMTPAVGGAKALTLGQLSPSIRPTLPGEVVKTTPTREAPRARSPAPKAGRSPPRNREAAVSALRRRWLPGAGVETAEAV
ncbi:hypothetical protein ACFQX6_37215 [Streptosporangium lutulentum]